MPPPRSAAGRDIAENKRARLICTVSPSVVSPPIATNLVRHHVKILTGYDSAYRIWATDLRFDMDWVAHGPQRNPPAHLMRGSGNE